MRDDGLRKISSSDLAGHAIARFHEKECNAVRFALLERQSSRSASRGKVLLTGDEMTVLKDTESDSRSQHTLDFEYCVVLLSSLFCIV